MAKTEVYSWRLSPDLKQALEETARDRKVSVAQVLEAMVRDGLARFERSRKLSEEETENRLRRAAARHIGAIAGGDPGRATRARERIRSRLHRRVR